MPNACRRPKSFMLGPETMDYGLRTSNPQIEFMTPAPACEDIQEDVFVIVVISVRSAAADLTRSFEISASDTHACGDAAVAAPWNCRCE